MELEQLIKKIKPNSVQHKALALFAKENLSSATAMARLKGGLGRGAAQRTIFYDMSRLGIIQSVGFDHWQITEKGLNLYYELGGVVDRTTRKAAEKSELYKRPVYVPVELGDTTIRPGAHDHRQYPSLISGERVWYGLGFRRVRVESSTPL